MTCHLLGTKPLSEIMDPKEPNSGKHTLLFIYENAFEMHVQNSGHFLLLNVLDLAKLFFFWLLLGSASKTKSMITSAFSYVCNHPHLDQFIIKLKICILGTHFKDKVRRFLRKAHNPLASHCIITTVNRFDIESILHDISRNNFVLYMYMYIYVCVCIYADRCVTSGLKL